MSTKTLTVKDEAYTRLSALKREKESFSDVILRITSKGSILDFAGILSKKEADELEKTIMAGRKLMQKKMDSISL